MDQGALLRKAAGLISSGQLEQGKALLGKAFALAPEFAPLWYQLAGLLRKAGEFGTARRCAREVTELAPHYPAGWELLAAIEQQLKNPAAAIAACEGGLKHSPAAAKLHYSLGQLLRQECRFAEAALAYEAALRHGYESPELYSNRCEAWYEADDLNRALASLSGGITRYPDSALLHRLQARLHWESGATGDPLANLHQAAQEQPRNAALWQALVDLLYRLDRNDEGRIVLAQAWTLGCPQTPELLLLEALGCASAGDSVAASQRFTHLLNAEPQHAGIKLAFAEHLLSVGDPARAEALCAEVLADNPYDQKAWAYRGTAWQLLGDAREAWLLDYPRTVIPLRVAPPPGYADSELFFADVRGVLDSLQRMQSHPIEQTLRGGTQTSGFLFRLKQPLLQTLEAQIRSAVRSALASFPDDRGHPFWGRKLTQRTGDGFRFAGAWSVRLRNQGFHTNHIHPQGWISSALYIALPEEVRAGTDSGGQLQFGVPPAATGLKLAPRRMVKPQVGELVLFPSYMWHGTVPFTAEQPRISVAFDLVPEA